MKKISPSTRLKDIITDYQLEQIFPGDCLSQLDLVLYQALNKMSFLIFSKAGSRSSIVQKMAATPSLKSKKNLDCQERLSSCSIGSVSHRSLQTKTRQSFSSQPSTLRSASCLIQPFCALRPRPWLRNCTRSTIQLLLTFIIQSRNASLRIFWNIAMKMGSSSLR